MSHAAGRGRFVMECHNADGSLAWREEFSNGNTTLGLNDMLNVYFGATSQTTTWYLGLVDNASFSAFATADTPSSHAGWLESSAYSEGTRQTWTPSVASAGQLSNSSAAVFTANGTVTIKGAFLISNNTKGGTTGLLWATGAFSGTQALTIGQTLSITYTYSHS